MTFLHKREKQVKNCASHFWCLFDDNLFSNSIFTTGRERWKYSGHTRGTMIQNRWIRQHDRTDQKMIPKNGKRRRRKMSLTLDDHLPGPKVMTRTVPVPPSPSSSSEPPNKSGMSLGATTSIFRATFHILWIGTPSSTSRAYVPATILMIDPPNPRNSAHNLLTLKNCQSFCIPTKYTEPRIHPTTS